MMAPVHPFVQHRISGLCASQGRLHARTLPHQRILRGPASCPKSFRSPHASRVKASSASDSAQTAATLPALQDIRVSLSPEDVLSTIQFTEVRQGKTKSICVQYVLGGSAAEQAGVAPGQQLMVISDPIRYTEMIQLRDSPSPRFVRDAIRLRRGPTIDLVLSSARVEDLPETSSTSSEEEEGGLLEAVTGGMATNKGGSAASSGQPGGSPTLSQKLEEQFGAKMTAAERRMQRRKDYMGEVSERNDGPLFALLFSLFVLPAAVILAAAYFSGYLDTLAGGYTGSF